MKTLYLHGLHATPSEEKTAILKDEFGLEVIAPEIDYEKHAGSLDLFDYLAGLIEKEKIRIIIGSSFGGYMGFHLSEFCQIPGYLFNPALSGKSLQVPVRMERSDIKKFIIIGKHDEIIDPEKTKEYVWKKDYKNTFIIEENFGHQTEPKLFGSLLEQTDLIHLK